MNVTKRTISSNDEVTKLIKLVILITVIFLVFYGVTILLTKEKPFEEVTTNATVQYEDILTSNILKQNQDEYYVLLTENNEYIINIYTTYIDTYAANENATKFYYSNLEDPFNNQFMGEESNFDFDSINEFKVNGDSLIKIVDGEIDEYFEGKDNIVLELQKLNEEIKED